MNLYLRMFARFGHARARFRWKSKQTWFHNNLRLQSPLKMLRNHPKNSTAESLSVTVDSWFQSYLAQRSLLHKPQKPRATQTVTKLKIST